MRFLGVDVHLRSFTAACIDEELSVFFIEDMDIDSLARFAAENETKIIAVDAPYGLNHGLMNDEEYREKLNPNLKGHYNKKVSEYELSDEELLPLVLLGVWKR
jgi:hypothetical protein